MLHLEISIITNLLQLFEMCMLLVSKTETIANPCFLLMFVYLANYLLYKMLVNRWYAFEVNNYAVTLF